MDQFRITLRRLAQRQPNDPPWLIGLRIGAWTALAIWAGSAIFHDPRPIFPAGVGLCIGIEIAAANGAHILTRSTIIALIGFAVVAEILLMTLPGPALMTEIAVSLPIALVGILTMAWVGTRTYRLRSV